jgi:hypothetical protein
VIALSDPNPLTDTSVTHVSSQDAGVHSLQGP